MTPFRPWLVPPDQLSKKETGREELRLLKLNDPLTKMKEEDGFRLLSFESDLDYPGRHRSRRVLNSERSAVQFLRKTNQSDSTHSSTSLHATSSSQVQGDELPSEVPLSAGRIPQESNEDSSNRERTTRKRRRKKLLTQQGREETTDGVESIVFKETVPIVDENRVSSLAKNADEVVISTTLNIRNAKENVIRAERIQNGPEKNQNRSEKNQSGSRENQIGSGENQIRSGENQIGPGESQNEPEKNWNGSEEIRSWADSNSMKVVSEINSRQPEESHGSITTESQELAGREGITNSTTAEGNKKQRKPSVVFKSASRDTDFPDELSPLESLEIRRLNMNVVYDKTASRNEDKASEITLELGSDISILSSSSSSSPTTPLHPENTTPSGTTTPTATPPSHTTATLSITSPSNRTSTSPPVLNDGPVLTKLPALKTTTPPLFPSSKTSINAAVPTLVTTPTPTTPTVSQVVNQGIQVTPDKEENLEKDEHSLRLENKMHRHNLSDSLSRKEGIEMAPELRGSRGDVTPTPMSGQVGFDATYPVSLPLLSDSPVVVPLPGMDTLTHLTGENSTKRDAIQRLHQIEEQLSAIESTARGMEGDLKGTNKVSAS